MRNTPHASDLPSPGRFIVYLLVISGLCFLSTVATRAQKRTISGQIVSTLDNQPLGAAAVTTISPGPDIYGFTDENGNYRITLPEKTSSIVVCSWGMKTKIVPVRGRSRINIVLEPENVVFEEVLVVFYQDSASFCTYFRSEEVEAIYKLQHKPVFSGLMTNR